MRVEPYVGYGDGEWVRVLARAVLAAPQVRSEDIPGAGAAAELPTRVEGAVRGWRSFATAQVPGADLEVEVAGRRHRLRTDRGGYLDAVVPAALSPGWHDVVVRAAGGHWATVPVRVIGRSTRYGVVSDIDDTVMVTRLPRPLVAAWNSFVRHENAREPVPGMARFYRELLAGRDDVPVVYLSTGAWNAAPALGRFLRRHGFPTGPLLLTDWGPTNTGWFRSGREHKRAALRRLTADFPHVRWVLVGDDGQRDPQVYAELVRERPAAVRAVVIRQLTGAEHVLAHGAPVPVAEGARARGRTRDDGVPVVQGRDGDELVERWRESGAALD
ncbi:App1 family protein [Cellulomonas sp. P22]|uniref:App1 family protein n=1 Tax=Cellulomonas sp. P22 TaxID=3373189 RepID=UPI0037A2182D